MKENKKSLFVKLLPYIVMAVFWITAPAYFTTRYWLNVFVMVFINIVATVSLRTIALSGNMSFAHGAFMGIGAYVAGVLAKSLGMSIWLTIPAGAVCALVIGIVTGWPFVRLRSMYYCMASMFLGVFIVYALQAGGNLTGGANGMKQIPSMADWLGPVADALGIKVVVVEYYFFFLLCILCCLIMYRFEFSRIGTTLRALSQSPEVAASIGISERFFRLLAVGVGCFFAGLVGAAYAHYNTTLSPSSFGMSSGLWLIMYMMIGGEKKFIGPIIGATILTIVPEYFRDWSSYTPYATSAVLLIVVYCLPGGLASLPEVIKKAIYRRRENVSGTLKGGGGHAA